MAVDRLGKFTTERDNRYAVIRQARRRFKVCRTELSFLQGYNKTSAMVLDQKHPTNTEDTLAELLRFPLMEAIIGRRSRRFCMVLPQDLQHNGAEVDQINTFIWNYRNCVIIVIPAVIIWLRTLKTISSL